ncbi:MAG TPA: tetratricopeptide repeat protein [Xanthobacteraceae bacterium]|nr:tetratricopeptide repeat protein [Xanthobacteraceae bacterium]
MSIRAGRVLILVAAGLVCLGSGLSGCAGWKRLDDTSSVDTPAADGTTTGAAADATGSIVTPPAEPGPSGEPVAPLSKPGLLGDDPNDDVQLGKKYFRANNFALAENAFRSAAEKHPNDAEAWIGLAAAYDRLRRFDLADRAYAQVIRLIGPTVEVLNDEGFSYMLRGDYQRAHKLLVAAQARDPTNPYVAANLKLLNDAYRSRKAVQ